MAQCGYAVLEIFYFSVMEYDEISLSVFFSSYMSIIVTVSVSNSLCLLTGLETSDFLSDLFSRNLLLYKRALQ